MLQDCSSAQSRCLIPGIKEIRILQTGNCHCNCFREQEAVPHHSSWFLRAHIRGSPKTADASTRDRLPFLKARELLDEKAAIVSPSIRLPSVLQHKKTSVHFHSTELAGAGKPSVPDVSKAWWALLLLQEGQGQLFRLLKGQCQLCCGASQGGWLQGIPCLSQAMNPKRHRQLHYKHACGRK